ncbi:MAG: hypothetical protein HZA90_15360 [Verrucomicrobia bacterium]|nr:hypothetical protein [Verrucomicrobiota bacterium]
MNETSNSNPGPANGSPADPQAASSPDHTPQPKPSAFDPLRRALHQGADDARAAAEAAVPKLKRWVAEAARHTAYGAAYAVAFQFTAARLLCPEVIKDGCRRGSQAGATAAERWVERMWQQKNAAATSPSPFAEPLSPSPQPGIA